MKRLILICFLLTYLSLACGCSPTLSSFSPFEEKPDAEESPSEAELNAPIPNLSLNGRRYSFTGEDGAISVKDDLLTICRAGSYLLTGELNEGGIAIEVGWGETVRLILEDVSVHSSERPAISVISAAAVILETKEDSVNLLVSEGASVISCASHLLLCGSGGLSLSGAERAVSASGTIAVESGTIRATASDFGFFSEQRIEISGGSVAVNAAKIAFSTEESSHSLGGILVQGGEVTAVCTEVALSARSRLILSGGIGSFDAPVFYRCEREENGASVKGTIQHTGGSFPSISS